MRQLFGDAEAAEMIVSMLVMEHFLLMVKSYLATAIPDVPEHLAVKEALDAHLEEFGRDEEEPDCGR